MLLSTAGLREFWFARSGGGSRCLAAPLGKNLSISWRCLRQPEFVSLVGKMHPLKLTASAAVLAWPHMPTTDASRSWRCKEPPLAGDAPFSGKRSKAIGGVKYAFQCFLFCWRPRLYLHVRASLIWSAQLQVLSFAPCPWFLSKRHGGQSFEDQQGHSLAQVHLLLVIRAALDVVGFTAYEIFRLSFRH